MNIRPATHEDDAFLREMLYEAAAWNPDWPRERMIAALADPMLERYHRDWGREGDAGVIAELDREPVGSAWYRLFTAEQPGYGFVDEKTPELGLAVVPLHRRKGIGHTRGPPGRLRHADHPRRPDNRNHHRAGQR